MVESEKAPAEMLSESYTTLRQAIVENDHQTVADNTKVIVKLGEADKIRGATQAHVVSLIRLRKLDEALTYINGNKKRRDDFQIEAAYI
jgi:hypothetical protein